MNAGDVGAGMPARERVKWAKEMMLSFIDENLHESPDYDWDEWQELKKQRNRVALPGVTLMAKRQKWEIEVITADSLREGDQLWIWGQWMTVTKMRRRVIHPNVLYKFWFEELPDQICVPPGWKIERRARTMAKGTESEISHG